MTDLEQLLSTPLPEIEPDKFSEHVIKKIQRMEQLSSLLLFVTYLSIGGILLLLFVTLPTFEFTLIGNLELFSSFNVQALSQSANQMLGIMQNPMTVLIAATTTVVFTLIKFEI